MPMFGNIVIGPLFILTYNCHFCVEVVAHTQQHFVTYENELIFDQYFITFRFVFVSQIYYHMNKSNKTSVTLDILTAKVI